jgi:2-hydroxychromene-2-carboxylate isomerase
MIKPFDFFFDFISPYSYLAHKQIRKLEKENNIKINYKPILLGGLHKLAGVTAAAFIPSKTKYIIRDCKMIAEKHNIKFKFNTNFPINSLALMRGIFIAQNKKKLDQYIDFFFDAYWEDGLNLNSDKILNSILTNLNINFNEFQLIITDQKIKNKLTAQTNEAYNKGVFGAPSFIINNKLFWGQDRLEFVLKEAQK